MTIAKEILDNSRNGGPDFVLAVISKLQREGKATGVYVIDDQRGTMISNVRFNDGSYLYHNGARDSWHLNLDQACKPE